ncbi:MAG: riboflavin biosynthesis protein RibF [Bacteroidota bacterium]
MRIYEGSEAFQSSRNTVLTMGTFDGVHVGHQQLLRQLRAQAQEINGETALLTFWPHPRLVLAPTHATPIQLLTPLEEKTALLAQQGLDHLIVIPFTQALAQLSAQDFIQQVLVGQIGMQHILVGHDHRFGKGRAGNMALLQEAGSQESFTVAEVPPVMVDHVTVSSTKIRRLLLAGDIENANAYLGRSYAMSCIARQGITDGAGLVLTPANTHQLIPGAGSYEVQVTYQDIVHLGNLHITNNSTPALELEVPALSGMAAREGSLHIVFSKNRGS